MEISLKLSKERYKATCACNTTLIDAPAPAKLTPKEKFSVKFLNHVLANKYQNHLPIQR